MNESRVKIYAELKEIAMSYDLDFSTYEGLDKNKSNVFFTKIECGMYDPSFTIDIDWDKCVIRYFAMNKEWELTHINSVCRLLCELIS